MFDVSVQYIQSVHCLHPIGRLETTQSKHFEDTIKKCLERETFLVINFSACPYLSSSGIRVLLNTSRELASAGGQLVLTGLSSEMLQVLQIAGLDSVFEICADDVQAVTCIEQCKRTEITLENIFPGKAPCETERVRDALDSCLYEWKHPQLAGFDTLYIAAGEGALGETLQRKDAVTGFFVTLFHCTGFIPDDPAYAPDFRIVSDPAQGTLFVDHALSTRGPYRVRVTVSDPEPVSIRHLLQYKGFSPPQAASSLCTMLCLDRNPQRPSLSVVFRQENGTWEGGTFLLQKENVLQRGEYSEQTLRDLLTWENIMGVTRHDMDALLDRPVFWLFFAGKAQDSSVFQTQVVCEKEEVPEDHLVFLTRKLYTDSVKAELEKLHGGYSATTFRVRSFDHQGRVLRPTVLKTGDRPMIQREAERCKQYAMPYILNNSAMILGTSFYCQMGALRYNFVGIGGEDTELKWLTHYFHSWPVDDLVSLFDKIFLKILKPWYGQAVPEVIYPYADHDPTKTFFPHVFRQAEEELGIPEKNRSFTIGGSEKNFLNPYHYLHEEYPRRRKQGMDYYSAICHGDLNMQNILLDKDMNVYLIDFSETRPRSAISDFARLEAIFMIESFPMENENDFLQVLEFLMDFYEKPVALDKKFRKAWPGALPGLMDRNMTLTMKMREYALAAARGNKTFTPYAVALLEWILPIVCYSSATIWQKRLSACVASLLCETIESGKEAQ